MGSTEREELLHSLEELIQALHDALDLNGRALARAQRLQQEVAKGRPVRAVFVEQDRPLLVEMISENLRMLDTYGSRFRRAGARALHTEGLTMDDIAREFGVSRQRVSTLIRRSDTAANPPGGAASGLR